MIATLNPASGLEEMLSHAFIRNGPGYTQP